MAEEKFGKERAEELRSEIEQLRADIEKLRSMALELDDEP
jgi:prefoldin subunit 5